MSIKVKNETLNDAPEFTDVEKIKSTPKIKRIATLDFYRGFAILFMIMFHVFMKLYDYSYLDFTSKPDIPIIALVAMGIAAFFGTWHAFFLFISSIVNTYVTIKKSRKGANMLHNLFQQILTGIILILIGWLEQSFGYFGYFGTIINGTGTWSDFSWLFVMLFQPEPLQMIGFSLILNGLILFLLQQRDGFSKYKRNMLIYFSSIVVIIISTLLLHYFGPDFVTYFSTAPTLENVQNAIAEFGGFRAWIIGISLGGLEPLFPFLATTFAGAMIGLTLTKPTVKRKSMRFGILIGLGVFILGIINTIINIKLGLRWTTIERNSSVSTYLLRLGAQIMVICATLSFIEFGGRANRFGNRKIVRFFRFWSIISLTVYSLQLYEYFPRWILTIIFRPYTGISFLESNFIPKGSELLLLFSAVFTVVWFYILQKLWSKINYVGTFEWFILKLRQWIFRKEKPKINSKQLLDNVDFISFGDIKAKNT